MMNASDAPVRRIPNGTAVAAYLSAMIGMLALAASVLACEASKGISEKIHALGKLWIPGAEGIGPYSGKETVMLLAWLASWAILHPLLRRRELNGGLWLSVFLLGTGLATTFLWPPMWHLVVPAAH